MNITAIIALLELKGIITREEGEKIVEFFNNKPQSTALSDAVNQVKDILGEIETVADKAVTAAKQEVKKVADTVVETAKTEAEKVAEQIAADAAKAGEKPTQSASEKK